MDFLITIGVIVVLVVIIAVIAAVISTIAQKSRTKKVNEFLNSTGFHIDKIKFYGKNYYAIDNDHMRVFIKNEKVSKVVSSDDIVNVVLAEGPHKMIKKSTGKAVAGGLMFGVIGYAVGSAMEKETSEACTSLNVDITINDPDPNISMRLITSETVIDGTVYKTALDFGNDVVSSLMAVKKTPVYTTQLEQPKEEVGFCMYCGWKLPNVHAQFCNQCGARLLGA